MESYCIYIHTAILGLCYDKKYTSGIREATNRTAGGFYQCVAALRMMALTHHTPGVIAAQNILYEILI